MCHSAAQDKLQSELHRFEAVVMCAIVANTVFLACEHYQQSDSWTEVQLSVGWRWSGGLSAGRVRTTQALHIANVIFVVFFAAEAAMKIIALGWLAYWTGAC